MCITGTGMILQGILKRTVTISSHCCCISQNRSLFANVRQRVGVVRSDRQFQLTAITGLIVLRFLCPMRTALGGDCIRPDAMLSFNIE